MPNDAPFDLLKKWKPLTDIPESPCGGLSFSGGPGGVTVRAAYSMIAGNKLRDLIIIFHSPVAFMAFEEFRDPWNVFANPTAPHCGSERWSKYLFPLVEVRASRWLRSFPEESLIGDRKSYRHFLIGDIDGTIHVLTQVEPSPDWTVGWDAPHEAAG
jgi:hypothetical protein